LRNRSEIIPLRATPAELKIINEKAAKAKMTRTDYMIASAIGKHISVVEDFKPIIAEMKRIGNNLNQLTVLAHTGKIYTLSLEECEQFLKKMYSELYRIGRENEVN